VTGLFDTSNYPVIGLFKDETGGKCMTEFVVSTGGVVLKVINKFGNLGQVVVAESGEGWRSLVDDMSTTRR
jgi:hypothetical protein